MKEVNSVIERNAFYTNCQSVICFIVFLLPIFLAACSAKLGSIEIQDVEVQLQEAEKAINTAREVNAPSLAFEEFEKAETFLDQARDALEQKNGIEALRFATKSITHAKISQRKAIQNSTNAQFNATILEKEALIVQLKKDINTKTTEIKGLETGIRQLRDSETNLQQSIRSLEDEKQKFINSRKENQRKVAELNESLKSIQSRLANSESVLRNYGIQVKDLSKKLEVADTIAESASKQKRAAIAEVDTLKKQMREQAKIYTDMIEKAEKQNVAAKHQEYLKKTAEQAREYAKQLPSSKSPRTRRTTLSTQQINAGKAALKKWDNAWNSKNIDTHLSFYSPDMNTKKINVIESKENQTNLNLSQVKTELKQMNSQPWQKTASSIEVEQDSVIGTYRYRRLVSAAQTEDDTTLFDIWMREIWMHQVQGAWKIYRETWQIYDNIPDYKE